MSPERRSGIAEGLARTVAGVAIDVGEVGGTLEGRAAVTADMAGWLVTNGGDQFVLDLAAAISRERHPANSEAGAS